MSQNKPLVLYVDDSLRESEFGALMELLRQRPDLPFELEFATTHDEALKKVRARKYAAAIIDVNLMGETGAALAEVLHEHYPHVQKAFLTGYDRSVTHENAEEFKMPVWAKPFTPSEFITNVSELLKGRSVDHDSIFPEGPVSMPMVLRRITSMIFF